MTTLLDAVDALTKPIAVVNTIDGKMVRRRFADGRPNDDPPLLDQLLARIQASMGDRVGAGRSGSGVLIDATAFETHEDIDGRLRTWILDLGGTPGARALTRELLRHWYRLYIAGVHPVGEDERYREVLVRWERRILDVLTPPKRIELTAPCPVCGQEFHRTGNDEIARVLNAFERESLETSYAMCAACDRVWTGVSQMRWLRILMDDAEAAREDAPVAG